MIIAAEEYMVQNINTIVLTVNGHCSRRVHGAKHKHNSSKSQWLLQKKSIWCKI